MIEVDVVLVNMEEQTAYCSDGVTRDIYEMYDAEAQPTKDPDEAIAAVVKVGEDQYIVLNLAEDNNGAAELAGSLSSGAIQSKTPGLAAGCLHFAETRRNLDGFLEFLGGAEGNLLARLDLDRLAGRGIAAHAGGALTDHENAKPVEANTVALLQVLGEKTDQITQEGLGLLLRHFMIAGQGGGELLGADGGDLRLGA